MKRKKCFKCGIEKPIREFYKHARMSDGHFGKCKECAKLDARKNNASPSGIEYERMRNKTPERRRYLRQSAKRWAKDNPEKIKAQNALNNAIRDGKKIVRPDKCEQCGRNADRIHGHHDDYSKPLEVEWLCVKCHGTRNPNYIGPN